MSKIKLLFSYLMGHKRQVTAAIIEKEGKILIARRKRGSSLGGKWEFPGGKIEPGERAEECLRRELEEEFSIEAEIGKFFCSSKFKYHFVPIELLAYKVDRISGEFKVNDHEEIKWVFPHELGDYDFMDADKAIIRKILKGSTSPNNK